VATEDDDPARDWPEDAKTELDKTVVRPVSEVITAPHDIAAIAGSVEKEIAAAREDACRGCYAEGQEDIRSALRSVLLLRGLTNDETAHVVQAVWQMRTRL
jgi:hypothetical protein